MLSYVYNVWVLTLIAYGNTKPLDRLLPTNQNDFLVGGGNKDQAVKYLENYGYLEKLQKTTKNDIQTAIKKFQKNYKLNQTAHFDKKTLAKINEPRCGVEDIQFFSALEHGNTEEYQADDPMNISNLEPQLMSRKYETYGRWRKTHLKYRFESYTTDMSIQDQKIEMSEAFKIWSQETPLSFEEVSTDDEDILISFYTGYHGDKYSFDGKGQKLAHAFFPGQGEKSGDMHFDADEKWTTKMNTKDGTNLRAVAAHEIGHSLGLSHSFEPDALMSPLYRKSTSKLVLGEDDITAIKQLYGDESYAAIFGVKEPKILPETLQFSGGGIKHQSFNAEETVTRESICEQTFDAVVNVRTELFFIKGNTFWRVANNGKLYDEVASPMSSFWTNFPDVRVDAAFTIPSTGQPIVFISGNKYWTYADNTNLKTTTPQSICDFGICGVESIDAAMVWNANRQVYIYKGSQYWKLDDNLKAEMGYPKQNTNGIPNNLDGAVNDPDGHMYFIKGQRCWKLDDDSLSVSDDYPRYIGERWFGCNSSYYESKTTAPTTASAGGGNSSESKFIRRLETIYLIIPVFLSVYGANNKYF